MQLNFFLKLHHILGNMYAKFQPWVRHMVCQLFPGCPLGRGDASPYGMLTAGCLQVCSAPSVLV
jgi:hypothetical protein